MTAIDLLDWLGIELQGDDEQCFHRYLYIPELQWYHR